jgi:hypothetical protein
MTTDNAVPDCLVLKIEEIDSDLEQLDQSVFIFYDQNVETYVVRGRRRWTPTIQSCTYSYECDNAEDLADFLEYLFCNDNTVNEILYNYDNFPDNSNDITFEFLQEHEHKDYEISGYNNQKHSLKRFKRLLRMIRKVGNYYESESV